MHGNIIQLQQYYKCKLPYFDVMNYGAVGDGKPMIRRYHLCAMHVQAFLKAWNETCKVQQQHATLNIPAKTFLLNPIQFSGPCVPTSINVQIGLFIFIDFSTGSSKIIASTNKSLFSNNHWLLFSYVKGLTLTGSGTIDGQGAGSWQERRDTSRIDTYQSPKAHIILTKCDGANINNITISAPEAAPNTTLLAQTMFKFGTPKLEQVLFRSVLALQLHTFSCDDCIAISARCSFINITSVTCGPGHGISIGSLGDPGSGDFDTVSEVHVRSCNFTGRNTTGVRIKTWQGEVKKITYEDIMFDNVRYPIVIDQFYCPNNASKTIGTSALAISDVLYTRITGTSSGDEVISLNCGTRNSCNNIVLDDIHLKSSDPTKTAYAHCLNVNGRASNVEPSADQCMHS
ncbi:hypothetical protein AAG906_021766 [Vitis piasezkii]